MAVLTRAQEREERKKMGRGLTISVVALILCWVPILGILLAAAGFISVLRCVTQKYRKRFVVYTIVVSLTLLICAGVLVGEVYAYSRNPNILQTTGTWLLEKITGQSMDDTNYLGGDDYSDMDNPGLGMNDDLFAKGYYDADGNFIPYEDGGDVTPEDGGVDPDTGDTDPDGEGTDPEGGEDGLAEPTSEPGLG